MGKVTIEELRKRFPIGTKVYPAHFDVREGYFVISTNTLDNKQSNGNDLENGTLRPNAYRVVWCSNKGFAKIEGNINKTYELWEK